MTPLRRVVPTVRGRDRIISQVSELFDEGAGRIVTLSGLAGVGKTRIARLVVERAVITSTLDPVAIVWVDASDAIDLPDALLDAIGMLGGGSSAPATVGTALDAVPRLVVIDGADAAPDAATVLGSLTATTVTTRWLITSRAPLRMDAERVVRVEPFRPSADTGDPLTVDSHPGVQMFFDVAAQFGRKWPTDGAPITDVAAIVDRLGGLPGAIELAASRTGALSPASIRRLLAASDTQNIVIGGRQGAELFAAIRWSVSMLDRVQEQLVHDMAIFSGPVPIDAITAVSGVTVDDVIDLATDLIDAHLLDAHHDDDMSTFSLNPLVRQHALSETSPEDPDHVASLARHTRWAVGVAEAAGSAAGADPIVALVERDLITALRRALTDGDGDDAALIVLALAPLWFGRGARAGHVELLRNVTEFVGTRDTRPSLTAPVTAWTALLSADRAVHDVDVRTVIERRDTALALSRECDARTQLFVLGVAVQTARIMNDRTTAVRLCDEGLELAQQLDDQRNLAQFEIWSGMLGHQELRIDHAAEMGRSALDRARRVDDPSLVIAAAGLLRTLPGTSDPSMSIPPMSELVEAARQRGDQRSLMWLRPAASMEALRRGDVPGAIASTVAHLRAARSAAAWSWAAVSTAIVARLAESIGDTERAARFQGTLSTHWPVLRRGLPPAFASDHEALVGRLRQALGDERFDLIAGAGALLSFADATAEVLGYVQSLADMPDVVDVDDDDVTRPGDNPLTEREDEILDRLITGETNKQIAHVLGITPKTVMHHTSSIYRKLGVRGRAEAAAWGVRNTRPADD